MIFSQKLCAASLSWVGVKIAAAALRVALASADPTSFLSVSGMLMGLTDEENRFVGGTWIHQEQQFGPCQRVRGRCRDLVDPVE